MNSCPSCGRPGEVYGATGNPHKEGTAFCHGCGLRFAASGDPALSGEEVAAIIEESKRAEEKTEEQDDGEGRARAAGGQGAQGEDE